MTRLAHLLPPSPDVAGLTPIQEADKLAGWLFTVAHDLGEPALNHAIGAGWPSSVEVRNLLAPGHLEKARNEARQLASEPHNKERIKSGEWGV